MDIFHFVLYFWFYQVLKRLLVFLKMRNHCGFFEYTRFAWGWKGIEKCLELLESFPGFPRMYLQVVADPLIGYVNKMLKTSEQKMCNLNQNAMNMEYMKFTGNCTQTALLDNNKLFFISIYPQKMYLYLGGSYQ